VAVGVKKLSEIMGIINELINEAKTNLEDFSGEAINWGDLQCVEILGRDDSGAYVALIEEASPDSSEFQQWIENAMHERFSIDVSVKTEW
jgi:hypothetical protein